MAVWSALVDHMVSIPAVFGGNVLNTPVYSYIPSTHNWIRICPDTVDPSLFTPVTQKSIYMVNGRNDNNEGMHFEVVISTLP